MPLSQYRIVEQFIRSIDEQQIDVLFCCDPERVRRRPRAAARDLAGDNLDPAWQPPS
jgi:hypothetical protein